MENSSITKLMFMYIMMNVTIGFLFAGMNIVENSSDINESQVATLMGSEILGEFSSGGKYSNIGGYYDSYAEVNKTDDKDHNDLIGGDTEDSGWISSIFENALAIPKIINIVISIIGVIFGVYAVNQIAIMIDNVVITVIANIIMITQIIVGIFLTIKFITHLGKET